MDFFPAWLFVGLNACALAILVALPLLAGLGMLRLFRLDQSDSAFLMAPVLAVAVVTILTCATVTFKIPLQSVTICFRTGFLVCAIYGCVALVQGIRRDPRTYAVLLFPLATTLIALAGFLRFGLFSFPGSPALDGWSYIAFAEYIRLYPVGMTGGLAPLYQYASHLAETRYGASGLLALIGPLWPSNFDAQMAQVIFLGSCFFASGCALGFLSRTLSDRGAPTSTPALIAVGTLGGWPLLALSVNNFDNLLVLTFTPLLVALPARKDYSLTSITFLTAVLGSAAIYAYPEFAAVMAVFALAASVQQLADSENCLRRVMALFVSGVVALALSAPYLPTAFVFLHGQLSAAGGSIRPGAGIAPELLIPERWWTALWSLPFVGKWQKLVAASLCLLGVFGLFSACKKRLFDLIFSVGLIIAGCSIMILAKSYDYGAYKFLLIGWWAFAALIALGFQFFSTLFDFNRFAALLVKLGATAIIVAPFYIWIGKHFETFQNYSLKNIEPFKQSKMLSALNGHSVDVLITDILDQHWLAFTLRKQNIRLNVSGGYLDMPHVKALVAGAQMPKADEIDTLLTLKDYQTAGETVWINQRFKVTRGQLATQPPMLRVNAPNGEEKYNGNRFFWIGTEPVILNIESHSEQMLGLKFRTMVGPSVETNVGERLSVSVSFNGLEIAVLDPAQGHIFGMTLALVKGSNQVQLQTNYKGPIKPSPNLDQRKLIVGVEILP